METNIKVDQNWGKNSKFVAAFGRENLLKNRLPRFFHFRLVDKKTKVILAKGGVTMCLYQPENQGMIQCGISICSPMDIFSKSNGDIRSFGRALGHLSVFSPPNSSGTNDDIFDFVNQTVKSAWVENIVENYNINEKKYAKIGFNLRDVQLQLVIKKNKKNKNV